MTKGKSDDDDRAQENGPEGGDSHQGHEKNQDDGHGNNSISVKIDDGSKSIHRGSYTTEELKEALGIDPNRELNVIEDGVFRPLQAGERITIKEGMEFISQQPGGGAS